MTSFRLKLIGLYYSKPFGGNIYELYEAIDGGRRYIKVANRFQQI